MQSKSVKKLTGVKLDYEYISYFEDGLAGVARNGKAGLINKSGEIAVPLEYTHCCVHFEEGLSSVAQDYYIWGFIDKSGKTVIPIQYEASSDFSEGLAAVQKGGKWGFINKNGDAAIPFEYDRANSFSEGLAYVKKNGEEFFIDKTGQTMLSTPDYYMADWDGAATSFRDGVILAGTFDKKLNAYKYGFLNKKGEVEIPFVYDRLSPYNGGFAAAFKGDKGNLLYGTKSDGSYFYIDKTGKEIIKIEYDYANPFSEGLAAVCRGVKNMPYDYENSGKGKVHENIKRMHEDGKCGFIDRSGEIVIPIEYELEYINPYHNFYKFSEGISRAKKDGKQGYIDKTGSVIAPFEYDYAEEFHEGLAAVKKDGKWEILEIAA